MRDSIHFQGHSKCLIHAGVVDGQKDIHKSLNLLDALSHEEPHLVEPLVLLLLNGHPRLNTTH